MSITLRLIATTLAAALTVLGVLIAVEVALALLDQPSWLLPYSTLSETLRSSAWESGLARLVGGVAVLLGLLLLAMTLRRGRPRTLALTALSDDVDTLVDRRGLQRALRAAAQRVDGISRAKVQVGRRRVKVHATSSLRDVTGLSEQIDQHVTGALDALSLRRKPTLKVRTSRRT